MGAAANALSEQPKGVVIDLYLHQLDDNRVQRRTIFKLEERVELQQQRISQYIRTITGLEARVENAHAELADLHSEMGG